MYPGTCRGQGLSQGICFFLSRCLHPTQRTFMAKAVVPAQNCVRNRRAPGETCSAMNQHRSTVCTPVQVPDLVQRLLRYRLPVPERDREDVLGAAVAEVSTRARVWGHGRPVQIDNAVPRRRSENNIRRNSCLHRMLVPDEQPRSDHAQVATSQRLRQPEWIASSGAGQELT